MDCSMPGFLSITNSWSLLKLMSIDLVMPSNHLILCCPLLFVPSVFPSIRVFPVSQFFVSGGQGTGVSASASVLLVNIQDWFPLRLTGWISLLTKGLSSLFQPHSLKASILQWSAFFILQLSHPYMTTGKTKDLTRRTFVGKVMSLLFNMLSRLVITFLPRSKRPFIGYIDNFPHFFPLNWNMFVFSWFLALTGILLTMQIFTFTVSFSFFSSLWSVTIQIYFKTLITFIDGSPGTTSLLRLESFSLGYYWRWFK